ncbi:uncharacterized protein LOC119770028 [Culex quinquefasciatus]|uniref:uncharacterized protein LOC119770028 n=1 Tax=Culex quinquefasciatus TaxID=7176 RepID=UPI0018E2A9D3|nr:uncharacterized protein LOC119770028 [Culex quinquefasciatus]
MVCKLVLISMLVCLVAADVSELHRRQPSKTIQQQRRLARPVPQRKLQVRNADPELESQIFDTVYVEDPVALPVLVENLDSDSPTAFQLTADHADFQAPYHYEKPTVENDYVEPEQPTDDYLPPHPVKRLVKYRLRA